MRQSATPSRYELDPLQRIATSLMAALVLLTFVGTNMQALLWQSSDWLVSTVLPAVVVDLTNEERTDLAAAPLQRNSLLDQAAQQKAQHMAANEYFAHFAPDGTTPWSFFQASGYVYAHAGENLAIHFTDSGEIVDAWMLSPAHRQNIVDPKFSEIGVGTARGMFEGHDTVYVVQLFGTPAVVMSAPVPTAPEVVVTKELSEQPVPPLAPVESPAVEEPASFQTTVTDAGVIVETKLATSSGLAVATLVESNEVSKSPAIASMATRPNLVLQILYGTVSVVIVLSLLYALIMDVRKMHYVQVSYSLLLFAVMGGLWFVHLSLTSGALVV